MAITRFHRATGSSNISSTLTPETAWQFEEVRVHLSAVGAANDFTLTIDNAKGAAYDILILTQDMTSITDLVWQAERPMEFASGDKLVAAWTNGSSRTYGLEIIWKGI